MSVRILIGDCRERLKELPDDSVDSVVCDPPYHLIAGGFNLRTMKRNGQGTVNKERAAGRGLKGFMGQEWDGGDVAFQPQTWAEVLRVLKPGGHLIAFSGTRTYHRLACAVEDAGFEVRDMISWLYGSGFPKSHDISKAIDRSAGADREVVGENPFNSLRGQGAKEWGTLNQPSMITAPATDAAREWEGWGTALKPACEPIVLARKPLAERNIAANVLAYGTGALNIDACRIGTERNVPASLSKNKSPKGDWPSMSKPGSERDLDPNIGRWPANVCHDGSDEVVAGFPETENGGPNYLGGDRNSMFGNSKVVQPTNFAGDSGSAARFFKQATHSVEDISWMPDPAIYAVSCSDLSEKSVATVLAHAVDRSMPGLGQTLCDFQAPSTSATASEFEMLCESVIMAIRFIARKSSQGLPPVSTTLSLNRAKVAVQTKPTGTMTIIADHWKSDGSAAPVMFSITPQNSEHGAKGSPRFRYEAKATTEERGEGNLHPTVKPIALMRWLVRLVTPKGGTVLDPFMGSGSTALACDAEQFDFIGCELSPEYAAIAERRVRDAAGMFAEVKAA